MTIDPDSQRVMLGDEPVRPGEAIRAVIKARGWKQRDLAVAIDTDPSMISHWVRGRHAPYLGNWLSMLAACGYRVRVEKIE